MTPRSLPDYEPERMTELVPSHLRPGLRRYIEDGVRPGDALWSIVCNMSAYEVLTRVDDKVLPELLNIYRFLYNYAPGRCWGSEEVCEAWRLTRQDPDGASAR